MPAVRSYYLKAWSGAKIKLQSRYPKITNKNFLRSTEEHGSWVLKSCNCNKKKKPYDLVTAKKWRSRSEFLVETFVSSLKKRIKSVEGKQTKMEFWFLKTISLGWIGGEKEVQCFLKEMPEISVETNSSTVWMSSVLRWWWWLLYFSQNKVEGGKKGQKSFCMGVPFRKCNLLLSMLKFIHQCF